MKYVHVSLPNLRLLQSYSPRFPPAWPCTLPSSCPDWLPVHLFVELNLVL